jgi:hypothetical protein
VAEGFGVKGREDKGETAKRPFETPLRHYPSDNISAQPRKQGGGFSRASGLALPALAK